MLSLIVVVGILVVFELYARKEERQIKIEQERSKKQELREKKLAIKKREFSEYRNYINKTQSCKQEEVLEEDDDAIDIRELLEDYKVGDVLDLFYGGRSA